MKIPCTRLTRFVCILGGFGALVGAAIGMALASIYLPGWLFVSLGITGVVLFAWHWSKE